MQVSCLDKSQQSWCSNFWQKSDELATSRWWSVYDRHCCTKFNFSVPQPDWRDAILKSINKSSRWNVYLRKPRLRNNRSTYELCLYWVVSPPRSCFATSRPLTRAPLYKVVSSPGWPHVSMEYMTSKLNYRPKQDSKTFGCERGEGDPVSC